MPVTFIGDYPDMTRFKTGFWSLDKALMDSGGNIGFPLRCMTEVYGPPGVGKSTWAYTIAAKIKLDGKIALADLEGLNKGFLEIVLNQAKFEGKLEFVNGEKDEDILDKLINIVEQDETTAGILDSVGAISPLGERDGDMGEANMGRRAKLMAVFSRKTIYTLRVKELPANIFLINHVQQLIGGKIGGSTTAGGDSKKYLSAVRIRLSNAERFDDGSYLLRGKVEKNRFGYGQGEFYMCCLAGVGFHEGLSAVFDCVSLGLAKRERTVKMGEDSYGFISTLFTKAHKGEEAVFEPFKLALQQVNLGTRVQSIEGEE